MTGVGAEDLVIAGTPSEAGEQGSGPGSGDAAGQGGPGGPRDGQGAPAIDRKAAFAAGPPRFPRRALYAIAAAAVLLLVLLTVLNRVATSGSTAPSTGLRHRANDVVGGAAAPGKSTQLTASIPALMNLVSLQGQQPSTWTLTDARSGKTVSLRSLRGRVVVLTFADASCKDICPVLGAELERAATLLGTTRVPVTFVTINTDPLSLAPGHATITGVAPFIQLANWRFLTGSLKVLNRVWTNYGISVTVNDATRRVSHNDLMYFIGSSGTFAWAATPFANEAKNGTFSLSTASADRFATGIARYAGRLAAKP